MAKKQKTAIPSNFIDLRQDALERNNNLIDDVIRPTLRRSQKKSWWRLLLLAVLVVIIGLLIAVLPTRSLQVPKDIDTNLSYQVYYPSQLPPGYSYVKNSANVQGGILFFKFKQGIKTISVSEQAVPTAPPDLTHIQGFKTFDGPFGKGAIGSAAGGSTAIVMSSSTLITVNSTPADQTSVKFLVEAFNKVND